MSLTFIRKKPAHYALFDGRGEVGWLNRRAIGLCGFASAEEARSAGEAAARALARWLDARSAMGGQPLPSSRSTEDDSGVPPPVYVTSPCALSRGFAFEIPLPPDTLFANAVHAVQVLYGARRSPAKSVMATAVGAVIGSAAA